MSVIFNGPDANSVWTEAVSSLKSDECTLTTSRGGDCRELLHACFTIDDPQQKWITSRVPVINPAFALAEVVWIMNGSNDASFINFWNPKLPDFAGQSEEYHGAYGHRLRKHQVIDQLENAYLALKNDPTSRQVVLQIWDAKSDLPDVTGKPKSADIPCNIVSLLKVRNNKLEWMQVIRSNDINLGVPYNFIQFTSLQEIMAGWLGLELGNYNQLSDSLHLYEKDLQVLSLQDGLQIPNEDSLGLTKDKSELLFSIIYEKMVLMKSENISKEEFTQLVKFPEANISYRNLLFVIAADAARRHKWFNLSSYIISKCTNKIYLELWKRWSSRMCEQKNNER